MELGIFNPIFLMRKIEAWKREIEFSKATCKPIGRAGLGGQSDFKNTILSSCPRLELPFPCNLCQ